MDLADVKLGKEGEVDVAIVDGKIKISIKYVGADIDGELAIVVKPDVLLDKLAAAVPGKIDDAVIAVIKGALK